METITVHSIETPEYREHLASADVVLARDVDTGAETVIYGRPLLRDIAEGGFAVDADVLVVELDAPTDEWEYLHAAVGVLHGLDFDDMGNW